MITRTTLPSTLYTAEQSRALDQQATEAFGIPGFRLMQRAGHALFAVILQQWPQVKRLTLLCATGNNGGDGLIVAGLAQQQGLDVQVLTLGEEPYADQLQGEALEAWRWAEAVGVTTQPWSAQLELSGEVIVDAMLGTGIKGDVRGQVRDAIIKLNHQSRPVVAVDIPSGLCSDTGQVLGVAVKAVITLTFIGVKQGLLTHEGVNYCGSLRFDSLRVPDELYERVPVSAFRTDQDDLQELLPARQRSAHKGCFGHLLVVGGGLGLGGAALMAAQSAARSGSGLVSLATRHEHVAAALTRLPEVMALGVGSGQEVVPLLEKASVVVAGPGLGNSAWADQLMQQVLSSDKFQVLDADALNYLTSATDRYSYRRVITPHPGEAARLLGCSVSEVQQDRFAAIKALQLRFGGTVVLKGAGSLTFDGDVIHLCSAGNPGMASGGMGDVLSGIIGALMAQGLKPVDAARLGVYAHAVAADRCVAKSGERGLLATDLIPEVRRVLNGLGEQVIDQ
ncbi:NAD(P)H-hydrate dehydratase [Nitrincola iocasae]|uniref:NAD(P)H-hydrate dehydratase n=1 Tax=Nitrincola iocasae TaxID=2614693 RepID=UPI00177B29AC|nr:NAD(P)H-hydrate dehydratase [Nitrincola iocasae]